MLETMSKAPSKIASASPAPIGVVTEILETAARVATVEPSVNMLLPAPAPVAWVTINPSIDVKRKVPVTVVISFEPAACKAIALAFAVSMSFSGVQSSEQRMTCVS